MPRHGGKTAAPTYSELMKAQAEAARQQKKKTKEQRRDKTTKTTKKANLVGLSATLPRPPATHHRAAIDDSELSFLNNKQQEQTEPQLRRRLSLENQKPVTFKAADDEEDGEKDYETDGSSLDDDDDDDLKGKQHGGKRTTRNGQLFRDEKGQLVFANADGTLTKAQSMVCLANIGRTKGVSDSTPPTDPRRSKVEEVQLSRLSQFPAGITAAENGGKLSDKVKSPSPSASVVSGGTLKGRYVKNLVGLGATVDEKSRKQRPAAPVRTTASMSSNGGDGRGNETNSGAAADDPEIEFLQKSDYLPSYASGSAPTNGRPSFAAVTDKLLRRSLAADDLPRSSALRVSLLLPTDIIDDATGRNSNGGTSDVPAAVAGTGNSFGTFRGNMKPLRWSEDGPAPYSTGSLPRTAIHVFRPASDSGNAGSRGGRKSLPSYVVVKPPSMAVPGGNVKNNNNYNNNGSGKNNSNSSPLAVTSSTSTVGIAGMSIGPIRATSVDAKLPQTLQKKVSKPQHYLDLVRLPSLALFLLVIVGLLSCLVFILPREEGWTHHERPLFIDLCLQRSLSTVILV